MLKRSRKHAVVYTAITARLDSLKPPRALWRDAADFVAFLDYPNPDCDWAVQPAHAQYVDPCRNAKVHKVLSHQYFDDYEYSIWVDGAISLVSNDDLALLLEHWLADHDIALFRHRTRQCIYQEAEACIAQNKDDPVIIRAQVAHYRQLGYPEDAGLNECMVLIRRHTPAIRRLNEMWFAEITRHSRRDQLSFNYVARQLDIGVHEMEGNIACNGHFLWHLHDYGKPQPVAVVCVQ